MSSRQSRLEPFDWTRSESLRGALRAGDRLRLVELLSRGAAWRDPDATSRLAALERRGVSLAAVRVPLGLQVDPPRFATLAAEWLLELGGQADSALIAAAATAEPVELLPLEDVLGLFSDAWRAEVWPAGEPERRAPEALVEAFGGLEPGFRMRTPEQVRAAAAALEHLDISAYPPSGTPPRSVRGDPSINLDELARHSLCDVVATFGRAAAAGWALRVLV